MAFYSRHQLFVLIGLVALLGSGLAIERWRRAHPDRVERVERFDREEAPEAVGAHKTSPRDLPTRPAKLRADPGSPGSAPVDLNRATADELRRLPGVGAGLAARIIEARDAAPFASVEDLRRVRGLGAAKLERVRPLVTVGGP
jgi:competence ComEA-like helix-hairpin-helix protein